MVGISECLLAVDIGRGIDRLLEGSLVLDSGGIVGSEGKWRRVKEGKKNIEKKVAALKKEKEKKRIDGEKNSVTLADLSDIEKVIEAIERQFVDIEKREKEGKKVEKEWVAISFGYVSEGGNYSGSLVLGEGAVSKLDYGKLFSYLSGHVREVEYDGKWWNENVHMTFQKESTMEIAVAFSIIREAKMEKLGVGATGAHKLGKNYKQFQYWNLFNNALNKAFYDTALINFPV